MTKVHMLVVIVVDHDGLGARDVGRTIKDAHYPNRCISPTVIASATSEVEWSDDHPLNNDATIKAAAAALFGVDAEDLP